MAGGLLAALLIASPHLGAQFPRPLAPMPDEDNRVAPFFDGWYENPDGTISLSFGYSNQNKSTVEIPLGPDNFVTPKEYDGRQPTSFPLSIADRDDGGANAGVVSARDASAATAGGGTAGSASAPGTPAAPDPDFAGSRRRRSGDGRSQYERERGVFTITIPKDLKTDVVWTLRYAGKTFSVPGRAKSTAYQLSWPMAMGSTPPLLRFSPTGQAGRGPVGVQGPAAQAKVGTPLDISVWLTDDAVHEKEPITVKREVRPVMNAAWYKHSGPVNAAVEFNPPKQPIAESQGKATTMATFKEPGEYVIRVRGDNFGTVDSTPADQCCWTNGYVKVQVTR
jgi:hypothetical protein